ncbi:MAG: hypothetical protein U5K38_06130 [Woeseiaceae bacterium]|nr:hypothetical protein [Woeseiaceae bacterium]
MPATPPTLGGYRAPRATTIRFNWCGSTATSVATTMMIEPISRGTIRHRRVRAVVLQMLADRQLPATRSASRRPQLAGTSTPIGKITVVTLAQGATRCRCRT